MSRRGQGRERPGRPVKSRASPRQKLFNSTHELVRGFARAYEFYGGGRGELRNRKNKVELYFKDAVLYDERVQAHVPSPRGPDYLPLCPGKRPGPIAALAGPKRAPIAYVTTDPTLIMTNRVVSVAMILANRKYELIEVPDVLNADPAANLAALTERLRQQMKTTVQAKIGRTLEVQYRRAQELAAMIPRYCSLHGLPQPPVVLGDLAARVVARKVELKMTGGWQHRGKHIHIDPKHVTLLGKRP